MLLKIFLKGLESNDVEEIALQFKSDVDLLGIDLECVNLMTMHSAKGLEFPVVFIPRCEEDVVPLKGGDEDEERRLFYVALTRAEKMVYITYCFENKGKSKFIKSFPKEAYLDEIVLPVRTKKKKKRPKQGSLF
nr:3'-5' exonuclease [Dissulfuribacter thermophilus]